MLGLFSAEILVRISGLAPQVGVTRLTRYRLSKNPYVIYEPVPETPIGMDQANALGYRGPVYPQERTANTLRIVVAGDSVTEGLLVADPEKTYPAVLQQEPSIAANKPVEVINLGVNG